MVKFIIRSYAMQWRATTQTSKVSKYQLISHPKLDKFQLQYCSRSSK